jgi:uncharacterized membrane protein YidH (DUF202 family)
MPEAAHNDEEKDIDPRIDLAAKRTELGWDRTVLAWVRTVLALLGAGVAFDKGTQALHQRSPLPLKMSQSILNRYFKSGLRHGPG